MQAQCMEYQQRRLQAVAISGQYAGQAPTTFPALWIARQQARLLVHRWVEQCQVGVGYLDAHSGAQRRNLFEISSGT